MEAKHISWSEVLHQNWDYIFNGLDVKDPGYLLIQKAFLEISDSYHLFLIFIAAVV